MRKIILNSIFIFISIALMGFKKEEYKIVDKKIEGRTFYFAIPNSFCDYGMYSPEVFQFVKCYEIELQKEGELPFFSEKIFIGFERDDKRVQNMTNKLFAEIQEDNYKKMSEEEKSKYFYSDLYPIDNTQKTKIVNDNHIFNRTGYDEEGNKFTVYETNVFLNKRYFVMDWAQYLTKNEKLLPEKKFTNFVEKNIEINEYNKILYNYQRRQILISKPKFDDFANYTDIKDINDGGFNGFFISLFKNKNENQDMKIFKISMISADLNTKEGFEKFKEDNRKNPPAEKIFNHIELINYRGTDFIKIIRDNTIMYVCYINFSHNMTGLLSLEVNKKDDHEKNRDIKYIYEYREQLIKDNL